MSSSSVRAVTRIAWRSIGRSRGRSALIVVLMMLPVAAMAALITLVVTVAPTQEESATHRMGVAEYEVQQSSTTDALRAVLPDGAQVEPWTYDVAPLVLPGRTIDVNAWSMDLDGLARGKLAIIEGRQPHNQQEVAVSAGIVSLAGVGIGEAIELTGWGTPMVVGLVEDPFEINARLVVLHASVAVEMANGDRSGASPTWLVTLPQGSDVDLSQQPCDFSDCTFLAYGRYQFPATTDDASAAILVLGGLALVEAILVAAAAFAVGVRRRQRELGLLSAAGAERRHLAGTVLGEGAFLGGLAAVLGVGLGVLVIVASSPWLDQLTNRRVGPVEINATYLVLAGGIGLLACLLAAALPARAAARLPVLIALSGRRPLLSPARRLLVLGLAMVVTGAVLTGIGAALRLSDPQAGTMSMLLLLAGAICGVLGFGASSPWLVERLERLGLRLPPSARIALRDTARARSRNGPIVTAILAAFAATVAISSYFASSDAEAAANWRPWLHADQLIVQGEAAATVGPQAAAALGAVAAGPIRWLVGSTEREVFAVVEDRNAPSEEREIAYTVTVGDAQLLSALGAEAGLSTLQAGGVVLILPDQYLAVENRIVTRPPRTNLDEVTVVVRDALTGDEVVALTLPTSVVATGLVAGGEVADAVISASTAERLGLTSGVTATYLVRLPRPVVEADIGAAAALAAQQPNTRADASLGPTQPGQVFRLVLVVVSLLFALSVTGIAVALGEAESRPDQRTLLAIGADPGIRRRIAAARAGVLGLMAGLLAVPAGLLPAWGLLGSRGAPLVVPLPEVIAAVIILPLAGIAGALLLSRQIPAWSALREAGS